MDALSEIFRLVRFNSAIFFKGKFTAPWSFASPRASSIAGALGKGSERLIFYHLFVEGACTVRLSGMLPLTLKAGDVVLFPHGDAHTMASPSIIGTGELLDLRSLLHTAPRELELGGGGAPTRFICGYLACDPVLCRSLLEALPKVLTVSLRDSTQSEWIERSFVHAVEGAGAHEPGGHGVLAKLSELLVVDTLRRYVVQVEAHQTGLLAGLRDPIVGRCLAQMHGCPAHRWTLESLAREAGSSRSVLAERFNHFVGQPPMQYLTQWRLALASNLLRQSSLSILQIALQVGYERDTAFGRAFRREFGVAPTSWRRGESVKLRSGGDTSASAASSSPRARGREHQAEHA
jgi:AraC-like DNA-binding protein